MRMTLAFTVLLAATAGVPAHAQVGPSATSAPHPSMPWSPLRKEQQQILRLIPVPPTLLRLGGVLTGHGDDVARLLDDLVVDSTKIRARLGWRPPFTLDHGLAACRGPDG